MSFANNRFDAKDPSLGYFYQVLYPLMTLLEKGDEGMTLHVAIEGLDDVEFITDSTISLFQLKHHQRGNDSLTDRSSDFWKSIRIWSELISDRKIDIENTDFTLVSTSAVSDSSFLHLFLSPKQERDNSQILEKMLCIAEENSNEKNRAGYNAFNHLTNGQKIQLVSQIQLKDNTVDITSVEQTIRRRLFLSAPVGKVDCMYDSITGWWYNKCVEILTGACNTISFIELKNKIDSERETLKRDNLPEDFPNPIEISDFAAYNENTYVKQLRLIECRNNMLRTAISDYKRAYEQRSKWLREGLCLMDELEQFDKKIKDNWKRRFAMMQDDVEGVNDSTQLIDAGNKFYRRFVDTDDGIYIRENFRSRYLPLGSYHMLSDEMKIGWHPHYYNLLNVENNGTME